MEHCTSCGREVSRDDAFCPTCGRYLDWHDRDGGPEGTDGSESSRPAAGGPPAHERPDDGGGQLGARPDGRPTHEDLGHEDRSADESSGPAPPDDGEPAPEGGVGHARDHRFGVAVALPDPDVVELTLGGETVTQVLVRNLGEVVDEFTVEVSGAPGAWAHLEPALVAVYPAQEAAVSLVFAPPREVEVLAGERPFRVIARSALHDGTAAAQNGVVDVPPFTRLELELAPERQRISAGAQVQVVVHNRSNHDVDVDLDPVVVGHEGVLDVHLEQAELRAVGAFSSRTVVLRVVPPREPPEEPRRYGFGVEAVVPDEPGARARAEGVVVHERPAPAPAPPAPAAPPPASARSGYVAAVLGWLVGGLVGAALLGGLGWIWFSRGDELENVLVGAGAAALLGAVGLWLGSAGGTWWALRHRGTGRAGRTAGLTAALTPVWVAGSGWAAGAWDAAGLPVVLVLPPLVARWVVLRGRRGAELRPANGPDAG